MTHSDLVERAVKWLRYNARIPTSYESERMRKVKCHIVFSEMATVTSETPDALGFYMSGRSILIECKATLSDYYADSRKYFRKFPEHGVGDFRYYMTPKGLITKNMTIREGWGLLEVVGNKVFLTKKPYAMEKSIQNEASMLYSACRRMRYVVSQAGVLDHDYIKTIR